jgi:hypothetical protein
MDQIPANRVWALGDLRRFLLSTLAVFMMTACGGGGGGGSSPAASNIFVGDSENQAIASISKLKPAAGPITLDRIVVGPKTQLSQYLSDFAMDRARDRLYVANGRSLLVFERISLADGDQPPSRVLATIPEGRNGSYGSVFLDTAGDILYATTNDSLLSYEIHAFTDASTTSNTTPNRIIHVDAAAFVTSIALDRDRNLLYAYSNDRQDAAPIEGRSNGSRIDIFSGAHTLSGNRTPTRVVHMGADYSSGAPRGLFLDEAGDRLFVSDVAGSIYVFENASALDGFFGLPGATPQREINLPLPTSARLTMDLAQNRLYAVDAYGLTIIDNASTAVGQADALRIGAPGGSTLQAVAIRP